MEESGGSAVVAQQPPTVPVQQPLQQPVAVAPVAAPAVITRELTPEEREFLQAISDLITATQELAYALGSIDPEIIVKYPQVKELHEVAREVVRKSWNFYRMVKRRMGAVAP
ncbi:MAG: hypothetical protein QW230_01640 [Thermofilum sp.]